MVDVASLKPMAMALRSPECCAAAYGTATLDCGVWGVAALSCTKVGGPPVGTVVVVVDVEELVVDDEELVVDVEELVVDDDELVVDVDELVVDELVVDVDELDVDVDVVVVVVVVVLDGVTA